MVEAPLLSLRGVHKTWKAGFRRRLAGGPDTRALDAVDLDVYPGEIVGLIGESGCGKTTLLRVALGLLPRDGGELRVLGDDPSRLGGAAESRLRRQTQLLLQDAGASLNPGLNVAEILAESLRVHQPGADPTARSAEALARVGLSGREHARPDALSGGEKRRVTLAMLSIARPRLILADEPTAGLDAARRAAVIDLLLGARDAEGRLTPGVQGSRGLLLVSHDLAMVLYACTRIVVMQSGRVVDDFPKSRLLGGAPASPRLVTAGRHAWTLELLAAAGLIGPVGSQPVSPSPVPAAGTRGRLSLPEEEQR